jgi:hypothetical protein
MQACRRLLPRLQDFYSVNHCSHHIDHLRVLLAIEKGGRSGYLRNEKKYRPGTAPTAAQNNWGQNSQ